MKTFLLSLFIVVTLLFTTNNISKATSWCEQNGGTVHVTTVIINGCPITVHYCWTNINGTGEAYFEILNIYVPPCAGTVFATSNFLTLIDNHIMLNHVGVGLVQCDPNNEYWGTVVHTSRADCYRYERRGYPNYEYNQLGGYSIVPCQRESLCMIVYSACYYPHPITGSPVLKTRCNIPASSTGGSSYGDNCNANSQSVLFSFLNNQNMIESECILLECICIPTP